MQGICTRLAEDNGDKCQLLPLTSLQDRFTILQNGSASFTMYQISVTPARAELVDFVKPYYYSAGVSLFAPVGTVDGAAGWSALRGKTVCIEEGRLPRLHYVRCTCSHVRIHAPRLGLLMHASLQNLYAMFPAPGHLYLSLH
jgi:hypothetical protein